MLPEAITEMTQQSPGLPADIAAQMPLDLQGFSISAVAEREEKLRKRLEEQSKKKANIHLR